MTSPADSIRRSLSAVLGAIEESRRQAEDGAPVEMSGLDTQVALLCDAAMALPPPEARSLLGDMEALIRALDSLARAIAAQRDLLAAAAEGRPDPHSARRAAAAAYARPLLPAGIESEEPT